jgi:hypothetical protein
MAETPQYKWPVPLTTDKPAGAVQISDLALAVENTLKPVDTSAATSTANWAALGVAGVRIKYGSTVVGMGATGGATVTMGAGFAAPPIVIASMGDEMSQVLAIQLVGSSVTASSFGIRGKKEDGTAWPSGGNIRINWIAIGTPA